MHTAATEATGTANGKYSGQTGQPRSPRTMPASLLITNPRTAEYARAMAHAVIVRAGTITGARTHGSLMGSGVEAQRVGRPAAPVLVMRAREQLAARLPPAPTRRRSNLLR